MADKKISQLTAAASLTGTEQLPLVQSGSTVKTTAQDIANLAGGGLAGTNYVYVMADGTDVENAAELSAAYTAAIALSPSATNRITIVAGPGEYNFGSSAFVMSTQYIDLVSLDGNRSVLFNSANAAGTISITANDVFVKGVDVGTKAFIIGNNLNLLKVENCKGGDSFAQGGFGETISGTFTDCEGGDISFGANAFVTVSGTFTNCIAGNSSFCNSFLGSASGIFVNCKAGDNSFAYASGGNTSASGTFTNCIAGNDSFGNLGVNLPGKLYFCRLTTGTFSSLSSGGAIYSTIDGSGRSITSTAAAGIGTVTPNASAILEVKSTTKGFLPPRMTAVEAEAIATPAEGLMVYAADGTGVIITSKGWWGYEGATWVKFN